MEFNKPGQGLPNMGGRQEPTEEEIMQALMQKQMQEKAEDHKPQALMKKEDTVGGAIANLTENFFDVLMKDLEVSGGVTGVALSRDGTIHVFVATEHCFMLISQKYSSYEGREVKPILKNEEKPQEAEVIDTEATAKSDD